MSSLPPKMKIFSILAKTFLKIETEIFKYFVHDCPSLIFTRRLQKLSKQFTCPKVSEGFFG